MPRAAKDHGGMTSDEWCSPPDITVPLYEFWGVADGDPCSNPRSIVRARQKLTSGGLVHHWWKSTYANWPYSQNDPWSEKAIAEMKAHRVAELVVLCMTATSTRWWRRLMTASQRNPRVVCTKRLPFIGPSGKPEDSSRFEPALLYYGRHTKKFDRMFRHVAMWSTWGR
jgi:DNA N-6-adenine-methyltransferase (Dam)